MKELQWLVKWIEDYENDYFGVKPHANLIKSIIECKILEIEDNASDLVTITKKEYDYLVKCEKDLHGISMT